MTPFKTAHATGEDWARLAKTCADRLLPVPDGANLGFVYVSDLLADDLSSILTYLRQTTGVDHWVGSVGMGVCAETEEFFDLPAVVAMVGALPAESFMVVADVDAAADAADPSPDPDAWIGVHKPGFGIVHADPTNADSPQLVVDLAARSNAFLVGGLTSSRGACPQIADALTAGGVSGVLFDPGVEVATGLTQGCRPIGASHEISDCLDNVIVGLDGRRALDVLQEDLGEPVVENLDRFAGVVHAALPIEGSDIGDYQVRNLEGVDPERGWLAIGAPVEPGDRVLFVRRDPLSAEQDLTAMLQRLARRLPHRPRGGLYISCIARGANMFGEAGRELSIIRGELGAFPLIGFYAGGEISNSRLYAYTGVLVLFL